MWSEIVAILAGLVLLTGVMSVVPALGKHLEKMGRFLTGFKAIIGAVALILGIIGIFGALSLLNVMLIIAGLVLLMEFLPMIPGVGNVLEKFAQWLSAGQVIIGVITIIAAVISLL